MTKDELYQVFSNPKYKGIRKYVEMILEASPDINDPLLVETAADRMDEAHIDGVDLSVENAIRLGKATMPPKEIDITDQLIQQGINIDDIDPEKTIAYIYHPPVLIEDHSGESKNIEAEDKANQLVSYAKALVLNKDIVLVGLPLFEEIANWTQLKLVFFSDSISEDETNALRAMMEIADETVTANCNGAFAIAFRIYEIWNPF